MKVIFILVLALVACGRLDSPMAEKTETTYTINKYSNGVKVGGWVSETKVYLKFEDKFIQVLGDFTIKENTDTIRLDHK